MLVIDIYNSVLFNLVSWIRLYLRTGSNFVSSKYGTNNIRMRIEQTVYTCIASQWGTTMWVSACVCQCWRPKCHKGTTAMIFGVSESLVQAQLVAAVCSKHSLLRRNPHWAPARQCTRARKYTHKRARTHTHAHSFTWVQHTRRRPPETSDDGGNRRACSLQRYEKREGLGENKK